MEGQAVRLFGCSWWGLEWDVLIGCIGRGGWWCVDVGLVFGQLVGEGDAVGLGG